MFGCVTAILHREELEGFVSSGTLSHLKVCFSRDEQEEEGRPKYVQDSLLINRKHVMDVLLQKNGYLFVCGWVWHW